MKIFRKEIHLPEELKKGLKIQAIEQGFNSMKDMIEKQVVNNYKQYKEEKKDESSGRSEQVAKTID